MNRRSFVERLALGAASFMILPGAGRVWRAMRDVPNGPPFIVSELIPPMRVTRLYDYMLERIRAKHPDGSMDLTYVPLVPLGEQEHMPMVSRLSPREIERLYRIESYGQTVWVDPSARH